MVLGPGEVIVADDYHTAGEPFRIVDLGEMQGGTVLDRRSWAMEHLDDHRRFLCHEPRGHADMYGGMVVPPDDPDGDVGIVFFHKDGFSTACGHGTIAIATWAIDTGRIAAPQDGEVDVVVDVPSGRLRTVANMLGGRVTSVRFTNVPSFVSATGLTVDTSFGPVTADMSFGGAFYAIVDSEAVGIPLRREALGRLRRAGVEIARAVEAAVRVVHPIEPGLGGVYGTVFTGMAERAEADLRNVTVFAGEQVDRSPCGTGTAAVMAVLDAMGLLASDHPFVHESIVGTRCRGTVRRRTEVGDHAAIVPEIEGSAWITGEHTFLIDDDDPLKEGFVL